MSEQEQTLTIQQALDFGVQHHTAGRLSQAESIYQQILQTNPNQPVALHLLGVIAHQMSKNDTAVDLITKALAIKPGYAEAHNNLGLAQKTQGKLAEAVTSYQKALGIKPDYADAHYNLGITLHALGKLEEAVASYRKTLELQPDYAEAYNNLGTTLWDLGKLEDAVTSYHKAITLKPDYADAHNNLGNTLQEFGDPNEALDSYRKALTIDPNHADAHINSGIACSRMGRWEEALASYTKVLGTNPDYPLLHSNLGFALNALGRREEALYHFNKNMRLNSAKKLSDPSDTTSTAIARPRLKHDIEQFRYLASLGSEQNERFSKLADMYSALDSETDWSRGDGFPVALTKDQRRRIHDTYSVPLHLARADNVSGSTLNKKLNVSKITSGYSENSPNLVVVDDLLTPETLSTLQRFLLESTIWFHWKLNGYIGAHLNDGLACPLLLQITEDLQQTVPSIFKNHKLTRLWAYKYDSQLGGINVHADDAAVNVNFWVTPNSANLDPGRGGLVVHTAAAPKDWPYDVNYTGNDTGHIQKYLEEQNSDKIIIPYAENRAAIFKSSLFHETDIIRFKPGYENRRINITMLFGRRASRRTLSRPPAPKLK